LWTALGTDPRGATAKLEAVKRICQTVSVHCQVARTVYPAGAVAPLTLNYDPGRLERRTPLMSLSNADVAKVALLARLRLSPDEIEMFTGQLNSIVDYVAQLQELDTTGVEPLAHGIELRNVFRDDVRGPALDREQALANAPRRDKVGFLVPAVLE
jgi:aspartyl-tRNA(Asn)/glutamyl-tRNA(Gln) amidotransferase subunit C